MVDRHDPTSQPRRRRTPPQPARQLTPAGALVVDRHPSRQRLRPRRSTRTPTAQAVRHRHLSPHHPQQLVREGKVYPPRPTGRSACNSRWSWRDLHPAGQAFGCRGGGRCAFGDGLGRGHFRLKPSQSQRVISRVRRFSALPTRQPWLRDTCSARYLDLRQPHGDQPADQLGCLAHAAQCMRAHIICLACTST